MNEQTGSFHIVDKCIGLMNVSSTEDGYFMHRGHVVIEGTAAIFSLKEESHDDD